MVGEADRTLEAQAIRDLVAERLGRPVVLHSVITCLTKAASDPASPVVRVTGEVSLERALLTGSPVTPPEDPRAI